MPSWTSRDMRRTRPCRPARMRVHTTDIGVGGDPRNVWHRAVPWCRARQGRGAGQGSALMQLQCHGAVQWCSAMPWCSAEQCSATVQCRAVQCHSAVQYRDVVPYSGIFHCEAVRLEYRPALQVVVM